MIRKLILSSFLLLLFSCNSKEVNKAKSNSSGINEQLNRINYAIQLKNEVAKAYWPEAAQEDLYAPLAFYTYGGTYVLHPNDFIKNNFEHDVLPTAENAFEVLKLSPEYLDTVNFNYANSFTDDDSTQLYYKDIVLLFTDFDLTQKFVPVEDLQDWCIMVLHEMFHSYQTAIEPFQDYNYSVMYGKSPDDFLGQYHKDLDWYKESVKRENDLLLAIWKDSADLKTNLEAYIELRDQRIQKIQQDHGVDIREVEDIEMLLEGHARFFEGLTREYLASNQPDNSFLSLSDKAAITNMFEGYTTEKGKGLYHIYNDRYWYPMGYNISMILRKYLPEYQERLYHKDYNFNSSLAQLLETDS